MYILDKLQKNKKNSSKFYKNIIIDFFKSLFDMYFTYIYQNASDRNLLRYKFRYQYRKYQYTKNIYITICA